MSHFFTFLPHYSSNNNNDGKSSSSTTTTTTTMEIERTSMPVILFRKSFVKFPIRSRCFWNFSISLTVPAYVKCSRGMDVSGLIWAFFFSFFFSFFSKHQNEYFIYSRLVSHISNWDTFLSLTNKKKWWWWRDQKFTLTIRLFSHHIHARRS